MKTLEAINKFRDTPHPEWASERWIKLGSYLEPHIDEIEEALIFKQNYDNLVEHIGYEATIFTDSMNNYEPAYRSGKIAMMKHIMEMLKK
jgi:hypothetical protein